MKNEDAIDIKTKEYKKEYICMVETVSDTQKKIRQWMSSGYIIDILFQFNAGNGFIATSLYRIKDK